MSDSSLHTAHLHGFLDRIRAGDAAALDELLKRVSGKLERLARKLLKHFPRVGRWAEFEDVLQSATLRLIRALYEVRPASMREFYGLAAVQIRRELLDLTRQLYGPHGPGANLAPDVVEDSARGGALEPAYHDERVELENWCRFHQEVENLPAEEREVVGLIFYHQWKTEAVAELFGVSIRTVQRRWLTAIEHLRQTLDDSAERR
jgi:RNA polymerase sigma factor (sigma-70 family)